MNRWFRVAGGVSLNLCLGAAYVYSVFLTPLQREFGWTRSELSVAFTLSIAFIAAGVLVGGGGRTAGAPPSSPSPARSFSPQGSSSPATRTRWHGYTAATASSWGWGAAWATRAPSPSG